MAGNALINDVNDATPLFLKEFNDILNLSEFVIGNPALC